MAKAVRSKSKSTAISYVEKRIVPVSDADPYGKFLLYGRNGKGKTRTAATAPKVLFIDINEKGTKSIKKSGHNVFPASRWADITYAYWYLREADHDFESFAIDTVTGMQNLCMKQVLRDAEDRDPNRDPSMPDMRAWGKVNELMKPLIMDFRNLPMHCIFIAQERLVGERDEEAITEHVPDLSPGSRGPLMAAVDVIGRVFQKEVRYGDKKAKKEKVKVETRMLVGHHEEFITKDRTGTLPRVVRNPNLSDIINSF